jgi:hypothetical protein
MPDVPEDWMGWLHPDTADAITSQLGPETRLVVECGTWLGVSARAILEAAPNATLICVDTWLGSPEHWADRKPDGTPGDWAKRLPTLYETCQRNLWPWHDRVIMVRQDSLVGMGEVFAAGLSPDLIYLDSKHTYGRVVAELALCLELFPDTPIVGDDFNNGAVAKAARDHAAHTSRPLADYGTAFYFGSWRNV